MVAVVILCTETGLAQGSEESADFFLQKGHTAKRNGDLGQAIKLYREALSVDPDFSPAKLSLKSALSIHELKKWALENLPPECRSTSQDSNRDTLINCANEHFSFNGQPIHPKIVEALNTWLGDGGDQIVAVNLSDSQDSDRFCCTDDIKIRKISNKNVFYIRENSMEFGYFYVGKTESNIHIIHTYESHGGSGVFHNIMLSTIELDYGASLEDQNSIIVKNRPRILLKKMGELVLGNRWSGDIKIDRNNLVIGKDKIIKVEIFR